MGSPVSPIVANIYLEAFEHRAITTVLNPPRIWKRYVDYTFVIGCQSHNDEFFRHIDLVDSSIQFTVEETKVDGSISFLDTIITPKADGTLTTGVYRKPTHTDLYLPWDSHHNLTAKYSVINTLSERIKTICSSPQLLKNELQHLEEVIILCKYPKWAINKIIHKQEDQKKSNKKKQTPSSKQSVKKYHIVVSYVRGICESFKSICSKHGVTVHFKGGQTLKNI